MSVLQEIQEKIDKTPDLRIKGLLKKRNENLQDFLSKFFTKWNNDRETIYVNNGHTQTKVAKRRSLQDIYKICKYYYSDTTLKEVKNLLYSTLPNNIDRFRSSKCKIIEKRVFYQGKENQDSNIYDKDIKCEYGYTWDEFLKLK